MNRSQYDALRRAAYEAQKRYDAELRESLYLGVTTQAELDAHHAARKAIAAVPEPFCRREHEFLEAWRKRRFSVTTLLHAIHEGEHEAAVIASHELPEVMRLVRETAIATRAPLPADRFPSLPVHFRRAA